MARENLIFFVWVSTHSRLANPLSAEIFPVLSGRTSRRISSKTPLSPQPKRPNGKFLHLLFVIRHIVARKTIEANKKQQQPQEDSLLQ